MRTDVRNAVALEGNYWVREADFPPNSMPTKRDVLRVFYNYFENSGDSDKTAARKTALCLKAHWLQNFQCKTLTWQNIAKKIIGLHKKIILLRKSYKKCTTISCARVEEFKIEILGVLEIGSSDITPPTRKEKREAFRLAHGSRVRPRQQLVGGSTSTGETESDSESELSEEDEEFNVDLEAAAQEAGVGVLMNSSPADKDVSRLMINLDRAKISTSAAFRTVVSLCAVSNTDPRTLKLSRTSIQRKRDAVRDAEAYAIRKDFHPAGPLTVHMDGKKMPPLCGRGKVVERSPVVVTGKGVSQLLSSSILPDGTGKTVAEDVVRQLERYGIAAEVKCVCSDTTSSNTGCHVGAVKFIEEGLGKRLIFLACRHHALEVIPKHLFDALIEKSSSPDLGKLCNDFESKWPSLCKENYTPATMVNDPMCKRVLTQNTLVRVAAFAFKTLQKEQIRADYEYLLQLVLIFIGETPPKGVHFRPPIALSSARFMGRIIYCLTMYMFAVSGEFKLDGQILAKIRDVNLFIVTTYIEPWFTATVPAVAPRKDLELLQNIFNYSTFSKEVSNVAKKAMLNHLWYLSPHCIALALFDRDVPVETKLKMVQKLDSPSKEKVPPKRVKLATKTNVTTLTLESFVNSHTREFFDLLSIDSSFLNVSPSEWDQHAGFLSGRETVQALHVVNDIAERNVKLTSEYNGILTRSEERFQNILLIMQKTLKESSKESLTLAYYEKSSK